MVDPTTPNILLAVPTRGSDPGTWDVPVNGNSSAIDGYFGGVQTISVSNTPLTLTAPAGTVTAGGGPTQAQNAVLTFTGALSADVTVTLPLPGFYIINNLTTTTSNRLLFFRGVGSGNIIAVDFGETVHIFNDGTNVGFVNLGRVASISIWAGYSAMPRWVTACTVPPFLLNDGTIYNFSTYPALGAKLLGAFGGNGITTFGVPDHRGRVALPYDGTGTRITTAGCGLNGQTLGATLDEQNFTLAASQIPNINSNVSVTGQHLQLWADGGFGVSGFSAGTGGVEVWQAFSPGAAITQGFLPSAGTAVSTNTGNSAHPNVQPSQVTGISVIRAA